MDHLAFNPGLSLSADSHECINQSSLKLFNGASIDPEWTHRPGDKGTGHGPATSRDLDFPVY